MVEKSRKNPQETLWAYAYEILPTQVEGRMHAEVEGRMHAIRTLLKEEHLKARQASRTWTGRVVSEQQVTHILVVSDSPDQHRAINRRLETRLKELKAAFSLSPPVAVAAENPLMPPATA
jgi:hypothetical protein